MSEALWDISGVDGLAIAQTLFGEPIGHLSPFQSLETTLEEKPCAVLRLCERNFRILYSGSIAQLITPLQSSVSVHQYSWLKSFSISSHQLLKLTEKATVKAPHRLINLPNHQAVPAQLDDMALLIWQHSSPRKSSIDIHTATTDAELLKSKISHL